jgi:hypothetical protein
MKIKNWSKKFLWFFFGALSVGCLSFVSMSEAQQSRFVKLLMRVGEERVLEDGTKVSLSKGEGDLIAVTISKPTPSSTPTLNDSQKVLFSKFIEVRANKMWTNTGIRVSKGNTVKIEASGQVNGSTRNNSANKWVGADGWEQSPDVTGRAVWVLGNDSPYMCLTGRIGNGSPFKVGSSYSFKATSSGDLFFGFNDEMRDEFGNLTSDDGIAWKDNAGSLNVTVIIEK